MSSKADIRSDDYYKVLGLGKEASEAEIAKAYKKLALKHHSDKNPDRKTQAEEEFKKLTQAYDVLRCAEKRKIYDQYGKAGLDGGNPQSGEEPTSSFNGGAPRQATMSREEADMIFSALFGGADPFGNSTGGGPRFVYTTGGPGGSAFQGFGSGCNIFDGMSFGGDLPGHPRARTAAGRRPTTRPRSRRAQSRPQRGSQQLLIPNGTKVVILGLTKSPAHNGKVGHVASWDDDRARYEVQLRLGEEAVWVGDERLWLRGQNITQLCAIEVAGLASKPELNGHRGEIQTFDASKRRYTVLLNETGASFALNPANCILPAGTCVTIDGLSNPECNGQRARILSIDRTAARYTVTCANGKQIKIKYQNVVC